MNLKRILALIAIILLVLMYMSSFILALMNHPDSGKLLMVSIVCTVFVPVLIHLFLMMNNVRKGKGLYDETYSYKEEGKGQKKEEQLDKRTE